MATIDLRDFEDEGFVLHFGGRTHEVDALTFGNALVSLAEAIRAINHEVNPGYGLEIAIEAVGPEASGLGSRPRKSRSAICLAAPQHARLS